MFVVDIFVSEDEGCPRKTVQFASPHAFPHFWLQWGQELLWGLMGVESKGQEWHKKKTPEMRKNTTHDITQQMKTSNLEDALGLFSDEPVAKGSA